MNQGDMIQHDPNELAQTGAGEPSKLFVNVDSGVGAPPPSPGFGGRSKGVPNQAIVALVLLVMSAGAIYGMRRVGTISGISGQALQVEYQPSAINSAFENRFTRAMNDLASSGQPMQVPAEVVPMSSFDVAARLTFTEEPVETTGMDPDEIARLREQQRLQQMNANRAEHARRVEQALTKLKLQSLIGGRVPVATISGKLVRIGDELADGLLTVESIDGRSVVVSDGLGMWVLRMGAEPEPLIQD